MTEVCSDLLPVAAAERVQAGAAVPGDGAGLHLRLAHSPHPHRQAQGQAAAAAQVRGVNMTASSHDPALVVVGAFSMIVKTDGPFAALTNYQHDSLLTRSCAGGTSSCRSWRPGTRARTGPARRSEGRITQC